MAKHFVAKTRDFKWEFLYDDGWDTWRPGVENTTWNRQRRQVPLETWSDCRNRHTDLALYGTARRAITEHWGTDKDESRVRVFLLDTDELEPVTEDLTEQYAHAERMMLKYTERCGELKRRMNEET